MTSTGSTPERLNDNSGAGTSDAPVDSNAGNSKATVRKDRACPFCHQTFTSSSLGRHLDFFIREKNPKPPDGIHDVHQIRKIRENITRRHTRIPSGTIVDNSSRRWSVTSIASPKSTTRTQMVAPIPQNPNASSSHFPDKWAAKNWTATGVINNLPPRGPSTPLPRILPRPDAYKSQIPQQYGSLEEMDDAHAAELALKEVLGLIKSAAVNFQKSPLFDFDFYACNFPALCLRILSSPAALFSTTPLTSPNTWPLSVPDQSQFSAMQEQLAKRIESVHGDLESISAAQQSDGQNQMNQYYHSDFKNYFDHLSNVFQHWHDLPEPQKLQFWHLELLRAYAQESEHKTDLQTRVEALQSENLRLRSQVDDLRSRQQIPWQPMTSSSTAAAPPEPPYSTPPPPFLPKHISQTLKDHGGIDLRDWDYEKLIAKYRPTVQKVRRQSASHVANDLRNTHERAISTFGPSEAALLRPIVGQTTGSSPGGTPGAETPAGAGGGRQGSENVEGEDSQDGDAEEDEDVDMEDEGEAPQQEGGGAGRMFGRQGAG